jgi:hypothetical protein
VSFSIRTLFATALCVAAFSQLSCKVNDYCLECSRGDGGHDGGPGMDSSDGGPGMDGSGSGSNACVQTNGGVEICDGKDNDCNGLIDDGTLPGVGSDCANQVGECMGGKQVCVTKFHCSVTTTSLCTGPTDTTSCPNVETCIAEDITTDHLGCTKNPTPERCDGKDNDCNGTSDEGDPGGGSKCGTDLGECVAGTNHCVNGSVQCQGFIDHTMDPDICDGKDNDCDGNFDEGLTNMGSCGQSNTMPCHFGTLQCIGGAPQCVGEQDPTFEACDGVDNNCNGQIDEGYDKLTNPNTCGATCAVCTVPPSSNANPTCANGTCSFACKPGYQDKDGNPANGCEFGPCFPSGTEVCDGQDNDCDGNVDESLTPPSICLTKGECAGTVAQCTGAGGWTCTYNSNVELDGQGNVAAQESRCDSKDNDCDGATDEGDPLKENNVACHDNQVGICQTSGHYECDPNDVNAAPICDNSNPGQTAVPEACDNVDNDCDGNVDEDLTQPTSASPAVVGEDWINLGGVQQMTKFEMSKPDASSTDAGSVTAHACSRQGVQPWVNVTYPQAAAACTSIGATLCGETEWHRACSVVNPTTYPITASTTGTLIEAEDYSGIASATDAQPETVCNGSTDEDGDGFINDGCPRSGSIAETGAQCSNATNDDASDDTRVNDGCPAKGLTRAWVEDQTPGFSGISDIAAIQNSGTSVPIASANGQSPRVDYQVAVPASGNWHVWVKMFAATPNDDTLFAAVYTGAPITPNVTMTVGTTGAWTWVDSGNISIPSASTRTVSLFMGKDGVRVDALWISQSGTPPNTLSTKGGTWSYATSNTTYQATVCNGQDYDTTQDATIPTGTASSCYANDALLTGGVAGDKGFDMSGNVKEWVLAEQPGHNPIRGGSSNNTAVGISCALNFTLADDTFFFSNVGFRCCRPKPP